MKNTALYFLYEVIKKIPRNQFAIALYNRVKNAGDNINIDSLDSLELLGTPFKDVTSMDDNEPVRIKSEQDYRFLYLYLKAFRKFPKDEGYYGISFCSDKDNTIVPESTLILGGNGTGKTSIFGAMEYLFTKNMSAANKQGLHGKNEIEDYIPFARGNINDVDINVITQSDRFNFDPNQQEDIGLCLLPFFCSEYDVDKVVAKGLDDFIFEQMGYTLVRKIIKKIEKELRDAVNEYVMIEDFPENIESQMADLDRKIGVYESLKPSVLSFAIKMSNEQITKNTVEELKKRLSKDFVQNMDASDSRDVKKLTLKSLGGEMDIMKKALGKNTESQYLMKQYHQVNELLGSGLDKNDLIAITTQKSKRDSLDEALEKLNYTRKVFLEIINKFFNKETMSDIVLCIQKYDDHVLTLKQNRQKAEREKNKQDAVKQFESNKKTYVEFIDTLKKVVYESIKSNTEGSRAMINEVMDLFVMEDEKMSMEFDEKQGSFKMDIILGKENSISFSPEQYLNTFRYKLFCMTLKIAIAFTMKQFYQINFPIIIDDVFYSSDFDHRSMVRDFFNILFKTHRDIFKKNDLQVILLSHDEVVIEAAYRGICDIVGCSMVNRQMMFDYREADSPKELKICNKADDGKENEISFSMRNLTYS